MKTSKTHNNYDSFFAPLARSEQQMFEIVVEITEINENKLRELGIEWSEAIFSTVESNILSIIESGF